MAIVPLLMFVMLAVVGAVVMTTLFIILLSLLVNGTGRLYEYLKEKIEGE